MKLGTTLAIVVLPASRRIVLHDLRDLPGNSEFRLATEAEFQAAFPDGEPGGMPPFGNLYGMPSLKFGAGVSSAK